MDGLEPIHEAQERDRKDPFLQRSVPLESNPGHLRTNDSPAKELTAGRSVRKRARARSRSAQNPENPPFEARALKQPLGSTVALQRSAAGFALEIAASLIMSPQTESRRARAGTASKVGVVNVPAKLHFKSPLRTFQAKRADHKFGPVRANKPQTFALFALNSLSEHSLSSISLR